MKDILASVLVAIAATVRSRASLQLEVLALRHQLAVCRRSVARPRLKPADRILWAWLSRAWSTWRDVVIFVQPATVIRWQRRRFREHWTRLSQKRGPGRPRVPEEVQDLVRTMSLASVGWGSPGS